MEESELISLFAEPTWSQLDARLRDAVLRDPSNGPLVDVIRSPLLTLRQLWQDAIPTLAGDPLAAERLCVTLQAASPAAALVPIALNALEENKNGEVHQPGMLRLRLLAVLVLAAARAQRERRLSRFALRVIAGLALQCGPAEPLARLEPFGAPPQAYDNLLRLSVPASIAAGHASHVYRLSQETDPVECGRWRCIFDVLENIVNIERIDNIGDLADLPDVSAAPAATLASNFRDPSSSSWSISHADGILAVELRPDGTIEIRGSFDWWERGTPFPKDDVAVVAFTVDHRTVLGTLTGESAEESTEGSSEESTEGPSEQRLLVQFGEGEAGARAEEVLWVGFVAQDRVERANALLTRARALLDQVKTVGCAAAEKDFDSAAIIPLYDPATWPILEAPPRTATNQVAGGTQIEGNRRLSVIVLPVVTPGRDGQGPPSLEELRKQLQAVGRRLGTELEVVTLPWVEDAGAVISSVPTGDDDPRLGALLEVLSRAAARTPGRENALWLAVLPGTGELSVASTADAARGLGVATQQGLSRCVAQMLEERQERAAPAAPALVGSASRLDVAPYGPELVLARSEARRVRAKASRLRVIGRLSGNALEVLDPPREEVRGAGRGAPVDTGVVAVALDRAGAELARTPVRAHRTASPATFAALLPISPEVDLVELRRGRLVLSRIERASDMPSAAQVAGLEVGPDGRVTVTWVVPSSERPVSLIVEISSRTEGDDWVPLTTLHTCAEQEVLPLWRTAGARRMRLVTCDGWSAVAGAPRDLPEGVGFGPVVIRRVNERTLWADVRADAEDVRWLPEVGRDEDPDDEGRLHLAMNPEGQVQLRAMIESEFVDSIQLGTRDVYRRP